jgi:uncharacterized membrane protein YozB (DUF420 family)
LFENFGMNGNIACCKFPIFTFHLCLNIVNAALRTIALWNKMK